MPDNPFSQDLGFNVKVSNLGDLQKLTKEVSRLADAARSHGQAGQGLQQMVKDLGGLKNINLSGVQIPSNLGANLKKLVEGLGSVDASKAANLRAFVREFNQLNTSTFASKMRDLNRAFGSLNMVAARNAAESINLVGQAVSKHVNAFERFTSANIRMMSAQSLSRLAAASSGAALGGLANAASAGAGAAGTPGAGAATPPAPGAAAGISAAGAAAGIVTSQELNRIASMVEEMIAADPKLGKNVRATAPLLRVAKTSIAGVHKIQLERARTETAKTTSQGRLDVANVHAQVKAKSDATRTHIEDQHHKERMEALRLRQEHQDLQKKALPARLAESEARLIGSNRLTFQFGSRRAQGISNAMKGVEPQMSPADLITFLTTTVLPAEPQMKSILGSTPSATKKTVHQMLGLSGLPGFGPQVLRFTGGAEATAYASQTYARNVLEKTAQSPVTPEVIHSLHGLRQALDQVTQTLKSEIQNKGAQSKEAQKALRALELGQTPLLTGQLAERVYGGQVAFQNAVSTLGTVSGAPGANPANLSEGDFTAANVARNNAIMRANAIAKQGSGSLLGDLARAGAGTVGLNKYTSTFSQGYNIVRSAQVRNALAAGATPEAAMASGGLSSLIAGTGVGLGLLALGGSVAAGIKGVNLSLQYGQQFSPILRQLNNGNVTTSGVNNYMNGVLTSGTNQGYTLSQAEQAYAAYTAAAGRQGGSAAGATAQVLQSARALGLSPSQYAAAAGSIVATTGGRTTAKELAKLIGQSVSDSMMQGRTGEVLQALQTTLGAMAQTVVSPNAALAAALNNVVAGLNPALKGAPGSQLLQQFGAGMQNPSLGSAGQLMELQALGQKGMTLPQILYYEQAGLNGILPNGQSSVSAIVNYVRQKTGTTASDFKRLSGSHYNPGSNASIAQAELLMTNYGLTMSQAGALLSAPSGSVRAELGKLQGASTPSTTLTAQESVTKTQQEAAKALLNAGNTLMPAAQAFASAEKVGAQGVSGGSNVISNVIHSMQHTSSTPSPFVKATTNLATHSVLQDIGSGVHSLVVHITNAVLHQQSNGSYSGTIHTTVPATAQNGNAGRGSSASNSFGG